MASSGKVQCLCERSGRELSSTLTPLWPSWRLTISAEASRPYKKYNSGHQSAQSQGRTRPICFEKLQKAKWLSLWRLFIFLVHKIDQFDEFLWRCFFVQLKMHRLRYSLNEINSTVRYPMEYTHSRCVETQTPRSKPRRLFGRNKSCKRHRRARRRGNQWPRLPRLRLFGIFDFEKPGKNR